MLPLVFTQLAYIIAFWVGLAVWYTPEWIGAVFQRAKRDTSAVIQDHGSYAFLLGMMAVGLILSFSLAAVLRGAAIPWQRPALTIAGLVVIVLGVVLRWWAIATLGRSFTRDVAVRADQTVVQRGPYHRIRHPAYAGTLLTMLGVGLALTNWASLLVIVGCNLAGHLYRVSVEERALHATLGQPYIDYMRRTKRFVPFVL
jgi:protein-S-isoprenylcysteine O-methyltransferase Ste14